MTSSSAPSSHLHINTTRNTSGQSTPRGGRGTGTTNQACAACKYQRRKCIPDCPLAPYFPADQPRRFLNAHRLFGVSNIQKTLKDLDPALCPDAMRTLIYQAEARALDPVGGCCRIIVDLERQLEIATAELSAVLHHLALCRQAAAPSNSQAGMLPTAVAHPCAADLDVTSSNQTLLLSGDQEVVVNALYANNQEDDAAAILQHTDPHHGQDHNRQEEEDDEQQQQQLYDYFYYDGTGGDDDSNKPTDNDGVQHYDGSCEGKVEVVMAPPESVGIGQQLEQHYQIDQKEYQMKASLVDVFDIRQELTMEPADNIVGVDEHEQEKAAKNGIDVAATAAQMAEPSHCRLGLGFSSF